MSNVSSAKKFGRPRVDATPVNVRFPPDQLEALDRWIDAHPHNLNRQEAVRLIVSEATGYKPKPLKID